MAEHISNAVRDVIAERVRQQAFEGWTPEHDDEHRGAELAQAGAAYALFSSTNPLDQARARRLWPFEPSWFKPVRALGMHAFSRRRMLVKAAALILAEIERLDRLPIEHPGCGRPTRPTPNGAEA